MSIPPRIAVVIPAVDEEEAIGARPPRDPARGPRGDRGRQRLARPHRGGGAGGGGAGGPRAAPRATARPASPASPPPGGADVIVFLDGDHSDYPAQLVDVLAPHPRGAGRPRHRLAQPRPARGGRPPVPRGARHAAVRRSHEPARRHAGHRPRAPSAPSPPRRCGRLEMRDRNYGWTVEMQVKAARRGLRVVEVPVDYRPASAAARSAARCAARSARGPRSSAPSPRYAFDRGARPALVPLRRVLG